MMIWMGVILALAATISAERVPVQLVATSPIQTVAVPAPIVTAKSSQVFARNYNTLLAAAPLTYAAPFAYPVPSAYAVSHAAVAAAPVAYNPLSVPVAPAAITAPVVLK